MDSAVLGALIGGMVGIIVSWGTVLIYFLIGRRVAKGKDRTVKRVIRDRHLQPMFGTPISGWSRAWAWKPVHTLDHGYIWLRVYWRRRIHKKQHLDGGADFWWQNIQKLMYDFRP